MLFDLGMKDANNDNEELSFLTLAAATANVIRYLIDGEKHQPDSQRKAGSERGDEKNADNRSDGINHGLRDATALQICKRRGSI